MKSLALKFQVLENCPVLDLRTALFFESLKFCWKMPETSRKICKDLFCFPPLVIAGKKILKTFFFEDHLKNLEDVFFEHAQSVFLIIDWLWPREGLFFEGLFLALDFFGVLGIGLEPCFLDSTSGMQYPICWLAML